MKKVSIADSLFMPHAKSMKLGQGNKDVPPTYFEWERADPQTARFVTDSDIKHARGPGQVAILLETFFLHPENYLAAMEKNFDAVLTHNSYFSKHKNWLWYPHGGSFVPFDQWKIHEKTKDVSILLSPKRHLFGHRMFHETVEKFGDQMDVYGLDGHVDKLTAIAPYRFTVVIEAEQTEFFFSEKLIDCFALGTVPIYWGCPNINTFFSVMGMFTPRDIGEVGRCIEWSDLYAYSIRLSSVKTNLELAKHYRIPEDWIYNRYPYLFEAQ